MKNILKYITLLFLGAAAVSCDFEDMPFDKYDSDFVFSNDKKAEGYYVVVDFKGNPTLPKELDRRLKISDNVMRHIIINKDEK